MLEEAISQGPRLCRFRGSQPLEEGVSLISGLLGSYCGSCSLGGFEVVGCTAAAIQVPACWAGADLWVLQIPSLKLRPESGRLTRATRRTLTVFPLLLYPAEKRGQNLNLGGPPPSTSAFSCPVCKDGPESLTGPSQCLVHAATSPSRVWRQSILVTGKLQLPDHSDRPMPSNQAADLPMSLSWARHDL